MLVRWISTALAAEQAAEDAMDDENYCDVDDDDCVDRRGEGLDGDGIEIIDTSDIMLTSNFFTTTMDLFFKCNYVATLEGIIANKLVVNTIFALPDLIPYWIKLIVFFIVTIPVPFFTIFDDLLGAFIVYQRFKVHADVFDLGIVSGKGFRNLF